MNISAVKVGDVVRCDVRGTVFPALVENASTKGELSVEPFVKAVTYRTVTSRQVVTHWRKSKASTR